MKWTLNRKLILIMASLSAAIILTMLIFNLYSERALFRAVEKKTGEITESIHLAIEEMSKNDAPDRMRLYNYLKEIKPEGVQEISIIDGSTRITASTNPFNVGETTSEETTELIFRSELGEFVTKHGHGYNIVIPVVAKGGHQGYIYMTVSAEDIRLVLGRHTRNRVIATLLIFMLGIAAAVILSRRYTKPIGEVVEASRSVSLGDLDVRLEVREHDEIGELKKSFNHMTEKLSELKSLERRLREIEHLSAIGELSRTVAHEIRNPLNFISLSVDHIMGRTRDSAILELLRRIKEEIMRLDSLVGSFLTYGKPLKIILKPVRIAELLEETLSLITAQAEKTGVTIERDYLIDPSTTLRLDSELIKACLFNVIQNSFQAMPDGGRLRFGLSQEGGCISIDVLDTGKGMDEELSQRVFEPFFTTREEGLGLGLAMTRRIIEEHGGRVSFKSIKGEGSTVTLSLPLGR